MARDSSVLLDATSVRPLADQAYEVLRDQIATGEWPGGTHLVQTQIAEQLAISRTPVREALARLAQTGLATWVPGVGFVVNSVKPDEIEHVHDARDLLEGAALRAGFDHITRRHVAELWLLQQEMADADAGTADYFDLTRRFHLKLAEPCPNEILRRFVGEIWDLPTNAKVTGAYCARRDGIDVMIHDHAAIIEAIEAGDVEAAVANLSHHLDNVNPPDLVSAFSTGA